MTLQRRINTALDNIEFWDRVFLWSTAGAVASLGILTWMVTLGVPGWINIFPEVGAGLSAGLAFSAMRAVRSTWRHLRFLEAHRDAIDRWGDSFLAAYERVKRTAPTKSPGPN